MQKNNLALIFLLAIALPLFSQSQELNLSKNWVLKPDGLTQGDKKIEISFELTQESVDNLKKSNRDIYLKFNGAIIQNILNPEVAVNSLEFRVDNLWVGKHEVSIEAEGKFGFIAKAELNISYPLYTVISTDWDDTRADNSIFDYIDQLHINFPDLKITHFFAPYHYTDPELSYARKRYVHRFIRRMHEDLGDEIGLHIHSWCHFIETTNVPCRTGKSYYKDDGTGYTTILSSYTQDELEKIFKASKRMFEHKGLPTPKSFRAGGWTADEKVLQALVNTGFVVDSSAVPAHRLSSWKGYELYDWNMAHWKGITEVSQPYFPSVKNAARMGYPIIPILEVPDNGVLVDYVSAQDMIEIFDWNFPEKKPLYKPTMYQIGFHPTNFFMYGERMDAIEEALMYAEEHSYAKNKGPVVYANVSDLIKVFK